MLTGNPKENLIAREAREQALLAAAQSEAGAASLANAYALAVAEGRAFFAGGKATAMNGAVASLHLGNPTGSAKVLTLVAYMVAADGNADVTYVDDATSSGALRDIHPNLQGSPIASVAEVRLGSGVLTGGAVASPVNRLAANVTLQVPLSVVIPPGHSFAVAATAASLATIALYATALWYETDL